MAGFEAGVESGFTGGVVEEGVVGFTVGTVVIGVVMSFWVMEIEEDECSCFSVPYPSFLCPISSLSVEPEQMRRPNRRNRK